MPALSQPVFEEFVRLESQSLNQVAAADRPSFTLLKDATAADIKLRIASLIHAKREKINRSNQLEFIDPTKNNGKINLDSINLPSHL